MVTDTFGQEVTMQIQQEKNAKKIEEYIKNQLQEDQMYDQISLKEYLDPFDPKEIK